ncbi:MAG: hypothetical protein C5B49_13165 [Bdellovibrio sp.]|nr:MAG: hypothetical protein C5B49_13165 [Bdellovibrio sp.]
MTLFVGLGYLSLLLWGLNRHDDRFANEFLCQPRPWLVAPWNMPTDTQVKNLWVDVTRDAEGILRCVPRGDGGPLPLKPGAPTLREFARKFSAHAREKFLLVSVLANLENIDQQVSRELAAEWDERVLIQSEFEPVLAQLKILRPLFAFGTSAADRVRWLSYSSVGLLPAVSFSRDVYVTPLRLNGHQAVTASLIREIHRRQKKILLGPLATPAEIDEAHQLDPDGYFVTNDQALKALQD